MFWLSLSYLILVAAIMVLWIDIPRVVDTYDLGDAAEGDSIHSLLVDDNSEFTITAVAWGYVLLRVLVLMWPLFVVEQAVHFFSTPAGESFSQRHAYWWAFCLAPPLRMCARHRGSRDRIWLPGLGWQVADYHLQRRLERVFSLPMIGIALLILPVLGLQAYYNERIVDYSVLRVALHVGTGLIWFAFATEFIVMVSVTHRKLAYCAKHWLDLVIILLPLVSFLRTLQSLRAARLLNLGKLQQLARLVRIYRLRGVALRGWRALLILDLVQRLLLSSPEKRIRKLEEKCLDKERELEHLREQIASLREQLKAEAAVDEAS